MKRLSSVLCAVDIGEPGRAAFGRALALARAHAAKMIIVYAVPPTQSFNTGASDRLAYLVKLRAAAETAGLEVRIDVQHGDASKVILLHARTRQPDLIVLSARHGEDPNGHGTSSVVEDVVSRADCPTLVVPGNQEPSTSRTFSNVLCAVDFSAASAAAIERADSLMAGVGARLMLLHVVPGPEGSSGFRSMRLHAPEYFRHVTASALQRLRSLIPSRPGGPVLARVTVGSVASGILRAARASRADIVVVGTQSRSGLGRRVFGVLAELLAEAPCPILAVPMPRADLRENDRSRPAA
jgi:nucleotide-binding universal stress UspA family protein